MSPVERGHLAAALKGGGRERFRRAPVASAGGGMKDQQFHDLSTVAFFTSARATPAALPRPKREREEEGSDPRAHEVVNWHSRA